MSTAEPISDSEAARLFADLAKLPSLMLAVSGGPDSTALLVLAARWRKRLRKGPKLIAVTVDHGLRPEARREAAAVKRLAAALKIPHRTLRWQSGKPASGVQAKARAARYRLLMEEARRHGAIHLLTAHTLDDQAETMLFRMARGSGIAGLGGMARVTPLGDAWLIRPLLHVAKSRLIATLEARNIPFVEDPSNYDPRYTRARWRALMPSLTEEGLHAERLANLAARLRRANETIEIVVDAVMHRALAGANGAVAIDPSLFADLPAEVGLRLMGRTIAAIGHEGPVELAKLEAVTAAVSAAIAGNMRLRRTLAGAMITVGRDQITVEQAPARRNRRQKR